MKILTIDIETSPNLAHVWSIWQQNVGLSQLLDSGEVICFAAKWHGQKKVMFFSTFHDGKEAMVKAAHELLTEADVVVHYNGDRFDLPHLNREFIEQGLEPPAPYHSVDLMKAVKRKFRFTSNKLDYVVQKLNLGAKATHTGHQLWRDCLEGKQSAWNMMRKYNKMDVVVTEKLHDKILPWIPNYPSHNLYENLPDGCPACGSSHLQSRGMARTSMGSYQRFQCVDCGKWARGNKRVEASNVRGL
jgi:DNA polymerase elongation subunit (family B)